MYSDDLMMKKISNMSIEAKIGQLVMVNVIERELEEEQIKRIKDYKVGNFIYFTKNLGEIDEIKRLSNSIESICNEEIGIPPIISVDQEGGNCSRFFQAGLYYPSPLALSSTPDNIRNCGICADLMSKELNYLGINMNLAPVCDINTNHLNPVIGSRSFGCNSSIVSEMVREFIDKHKHSFTCAKHFPGHGDTIIDSHLSLPHLTKLELF